MEALQLVLLGALQGSSGPSSHGGVAQELLDRQTRMDVAVFFSLPFSPSLKSESCPVIRCLRFQAVLSPWSVALDYVVHKAAVTFLGQQVSYICLIFVFFFFSSLAFSSFKVKGVFSQPSGLYFSGQDLTVREVFVVP